MVAKARISAMKIKDDEVRMERARTMFSPPASIVEVHLVRCCAMVREKNVTSNNDIFDYNHVIRSPITRT